MDSSNKPPPILEIEDVLHTTVTSPHINFASPTPVEIDTALHISVDTQEDRLNVKGNEQTTKGGEPSINPLIVGPKVPLQGIDDHLQFWTTYDRVAGAYDKELLDGWNKSLDVLLIFAGLFSAINTAFIIESYRGLQADPVETTNTLLRLLITHRNDNDTLSVDELNPGIPSASSFSVNSLFFSSLSLSLTSAFGAVTAKQWLTEYNSVGATKAVHIQGRMRQRKFDGLKTWHLRFIIELLPMGLQASLLLFLAGVVNLLWTMDRRVATMQLVLSAVGIAFYFVTMLIGIFDPDSPFQTPLSKYLPAYIAKTRRRIKLIIPISRFMAEHNWPEWLPSLKEVFNGVSEHVAVQQVQSFFVERFIAVKQSIGFSKEKSDSESAADEHEQWSSTDIVAAQSVMWLLEQAEHPDVTITALDAIPRLPPDLLRKLINEREDLLERLNGFYSSLRPPCLPGRTDEWRRSWPNRAVVAGIALRHIGKARKPPPRSIVPGSYPSRIIVLNSSVHCAEEDPLEVTKRELLSFPGLCLQYDNLYPVLKDPSMNVGHSFPFDVELVDPRNVSIGNSFSTSVSPLRLVLDNIIQFCCEIPLEDGVTYDDSSSYFFDILQSHLLGIHTQLSRDTLSHIALMLAAVCRCLKRRASSSSNEEERLRRLILKRLCDVHKGQALLDNVILALSFISLRDDIDRVGFKIFRVVFLATWDLFAHTFSRPTNLIMEPNFPKALLRLARENRPDVGFQLKIALIVDRCIAGDWVSPLHEEYGEDVIHLIKSPLSPESASITPIFYVGTLDMITSSLDQDHFLRVAEHLFSSHRIYKAMDQGLSSKIPLPLFLKFTKRLIEIQLSVSYNVGALMEGQIWLVVGFLAKPMSVWNPRHGVSIAFINRILQEDEELHLPGYLLSEGILPANTYIGSARSRTLKPIEAENLKIYWKPETPAIWRPPPIHEATRYVWYGEAILLLWKKAKLEVARGKLAPDWDDSILFETQVASGMMGYYKIVSDKGYHGIDWQSLLEYFHTLLLKTGCPPQVEGDHHVTAPEGNDEQPERNPRRRIIEMLPHVENLVNKGSVISAYKKDEMR